MGGWRAAGARSERGEATEAPRRRGHGGGRGAESSRQAASRAHSRADQGRGKLGGGLKGRELGLRSTAGSPQGRLPRVSTAAVRFVAFVRFVRFAKSERRAV